MKNHLDTFYLFICSLILFTKLHFIGRFRFLNFFIIIITVDEKKVASAKVKQPYCFVYFEPQKCEYMYIPLKKKKPLNFV